MSEKGRKPITVLQMILTYVFVIAVYALLYYRINYDPPVHGPNASTRIVEFGYYAMPPLIAYCTVAYPIIYFRKIRPRNKGE